MPSRNVDARPTKRFFVSMLTRDIELRDAILDLLDNCIDGVVRTIKKQSGGAKRGKNTPPDGKPYRGFEARIVAKPGHFQISDNCGGIDYNTLIEKAFRMGRPEGSYDEMIETVGVYGIGMKRAIFKMGKDATVFSQHEGSAYQVEISPQWLASDNDWELPIKTVKSQQSNGTTIRVQELHGPISHQFDKENSTFLEELVKLIGRLYAVIIGKGFVVYVNDAQVEPVEIKLLATKTATKREEAINPYVFKGRFGDVSLEIVVGFYRPLASESEAEEALETPQATRDRAGWSVICNDRLVLYADKTPITGWGVGNVPNYHGQFISIAGVVTFQSANPSLLPLNTMKRGLDTSSQLYFTALNYMMEGLKLFTDFTNKWKKKESESDPAFQVATAVDPTSVPTTMPDTAFRKVPENKLGSGSEARVFKPTLPRPSTPEKTQERIVFTRPIREIRLASRYLFDGEERPASEVGGECFDYVVREARR